MKQFDESFYTKDFYTSKINMLPNYLTKQKFKEKIGMVKREFTLDDLEAGKHVVELEDGRKALVVESGKGEKSLFFYKDLRWTHLSNYNQDLKTEEAHLSDIVKVSTFKYFPDAVSRHDLIWQREEKSESQLQYEECEKKMKELQEQMDILSKKIKEGK